MLWRRRPALSFLEAVKRESFLSATACSALALTLCVCVCQRRGVESGQTFVQWLSTFFADVVELVRRECMWCVEVFAEQPLVISELVQSLVDQVKVSPLPLPSLYLPSLRTCLVFDFLRARCVCFLLSALCGRVYEHPADCLGRRRQDFMATGSLPAFCNVLCRSESRTSQVRIAAARQCCQEGLPNEEPCERRERL